MRCVRCSSVFSSSAISAARGASTSCVRLQNVFLVDVAQLDLRDELRLHLVDAEADHQVRHDLRLRTPSRG